MRIDLWTVFACTAVLLVFLAGFYIGSLSSNTYEVDRTKTIGGRECVRSSEGDSWWCEFNDFEKGKK
jgi:hypothetical protein